MNSQTEKKNLYNLVIDNPNAGQGRIIENAIQSNENTMEVLETVTAARSNNCNNSEKKQLYSLEKTHREKSLTNYVVNESKMENHLPQKSTIQLTPAYKPNLQLKTNFTITVKNIEYLVDEKSGNIIDKFLDLIFNVSTKDGVIEYPIIHIAIDKVTEADIINKIPQAVSYCKNKAELRDELYLYLNQLIANYQGPIWSIFQRPGWKINLLDYVTSDGAIVRPEQTVRADGDLHIFDRFSGSILPEYIKMCGTIKEKGKMQTILCYVLTGFLHSVFEDAGFPVKHALFIVGPRGSKKTSIAQCFSQLGKERQTVRFNFQATEFGIQFNLQHYADRVMLIDDLAPSMDYSDKKRKEKMLESILRLCGDSGERVINTAFMKSGADQIDYRVRGGIIITGEYFYGTGSESSIARAVVVSLEKDSVQNTLLSHFQNHSEIFESLIFRFIKFVGLNYDQTINTIRNTIEQIRDNSMGYHFSNARFLDYLGQYMAIAHLLYGMFVAEGNTLDGNAFLADYHANICHVLAENDKQMRSQAPVDIVVSAIIGEMNSCHIAPWGCPFINGVKIIRSEDAIYFRQMDLPDMVKGYARKNNLPDLLLSSSEIGKLLEVHGFCATVMEGGQKRRGKRFKEYGKDRLMSIPMEKVIEFEKSHDF